MSLAVRFFGGGAVLLLLFLGIGFVLPGNWTVERQAVLPVPPEEVFPFLDSPEGWAEWTPWPESGAERSGPPRGTGSSRRWDDAEWGDGIFTITAAEPPRSIAYRVEVEEGSLVTEGSILLEPAHGDSTLARWVETGDFGWNPLLGWISLLMDRLQGREMERSLHRLGERVSRPAPPTPAGSAG